MARHIRWIVVLIVAGSFSLCGCGPGYVEIPGAQAVPPKEDVDDIDRDKDKDKDEEEEKPELGPFEVSKEVLIHGNAYITRNVEYAPVITAEGVSGWSHPGVVMSVWFRVPKAGLLNMALYGKSALPAKLRAKVGEETFSVAVGNRENGEIRIGQVLIGEPGYVRVDLQGVSCVSDYGSYLSLKVGGESTEGGVVSVPAATEKDNWPYWGRRGPSVHMTYAKPKQDIRYFYNEMTVPEGNDVLHSYFMSNGFNAGYMGAQVNSVDPAQRRILYSVWSEWVTDNPSEIPEEYRVVPLRQGAGVHIGNFGGEGSGGQSYLLYPWEAGRTYKFLTEVVPYGNEWTIYTGYFCGHDGKWRLIASFRQPSPGKKHETHYTGMHSFLENFNPEMGYVERAVCFANQWVRTTDGEWIELCEGTFTCDSTGHEGIRLDYGGGLDNGSFYLRNCGFFNDNTPHQTGFNRPAGGSPPDIDLDALATIPSVI